MFNIIGILVLIFASVSYAEDQIKITGSYTYRTDEQSQEIIGDLACFTPDSASKKLIPRQENDRRDVWFCFNNSEQALKLLKVKSELNNKCGYEAEAKVIIKDYKVYSGEGDGFDTANLVSVTTVAPQKIISCD